MKRPPVDLSALTSEQAMPMAEALQRSAAPVAAAVAPARPTERAEAKAQPKGRALATEAAKTAELQGLSFKVPPGFRKRFRQRAASADLKMNELLFAALDAWEEKTGVKK